jgi:hypothetical protein
MLTTKTSGSSLLKVKMSAIALHLCGLARKAAQARPILFDLQHIVREFGLGRLAGGVNGY